jgi:hypothetical protein
MSAFVKKYPRAKVSRHPKVNGWVIDLIQRDGARPKRVAATYATASFADRAARLKLGFKVPAPERPAPRLIPIIEEPAPEPAAAPRTRAPHGARSTGTCAPCGRPMRPAGSKASTYPGTTLRQREGLCQTCYQKSLRTVAA